MEVIELAQQIAITFWQWVILAALILVGVIVNRFDDPDEILVAFKYKKMPKMSPIPIRTINKGFFGAIWMWLTTTRQWEITEDWQYELDGSKFVIPKGFQFDGASIPKFLATFLSPVGVLLMGGLIHDYAYKYAALKPSTKKGVRWDINQKQADKLFRDICIEVNGFKVLNYLAYYALRLAGFVAWNGHRKRDEFDLNGKRILP